MNKSNKKKILIVGGAGYIGSHIVLVALEEGYDVIVFDDLSTGSRENIDQRVKFVEGSTLSKSDLTKVFENQKFDGVIHLGASKAAGESMISPIKYAENNIVGSLNLVGACLKYNVKKFVFSSSAAVYGDPKYNPIDEKHPSSPTNYYGYTKLSIEQNLKWFSNLKGIRYAVLRYFNAAGYDSKKRVNGIERNPQNLNPNCDGSCIRNSS
jgi:UDP-glucose 4-epimerase